MTPGHDVRGNSGFGWLVFLMIRGLLLWLMVPASTVGWLLAFLPLHRRRVSLGQFLGWVDLNFAALLTRSVLRPLFRSPPPWVPLRALPQVVHRIDLLDFM